MKALRRLFIFVLVILFFVKMQNVVFPLVSSVLIDVLPSEFVSNQYTDKLKSSGLFGETVIYNGTKIEDAIKFNDEIDNMAREITKDCSTEKQKAKALYTWVGSNIVYDDNKADVVLNGEGDTKMPESGAIIAYQTKSGICFDKASLYVAMARAVNLKVRLISGEAFDGEKYVGHAWNEVYLNDEQRWISVDTTFYDGGNYFDSNLFSKHNVESIAGEW